MSKHKAVEVYTTTCRSLVSTRASSKDFAQDGHQCGPMVGKMHSLCDGHIFSPVVAGRASGHIDSPICSDSVEKHSVRSHKVVSDEMLVDDGDKKNANFLHKWTGR